MVNLLKVLFSPKSKPAVQNFGRKHWSDFSDKERIKLLRTKEFPEDMFNRLLIRGLSVEVWALLVHTFGEKAAVQVMSYVGARKIGAFIDEFNGVFKQEPERGIQCAIAILESDRPDWTLVQQFLRSLQLKDGTARLKEWIAASVEDICYDGASEAIESIEVLGGESENADKYLAEIIARDKNDFWRKDYIKNGKNSRVVTLLSDRPDSPEEQLEIAKEIFEGYVATNDGLYRSRLQRVNDPSALDGGLFMSFPKYDGDGDLKVAESDAMRSCFVDRLNQIEAESPELFQAFIDKSVYSDLKLTNWSIPERGLEKWFTYTYLGDGQAQGFYPLFQDPEDRQYSVPREYLTPHTAIRCRFWYEVVRHVHANWSKQVAEGVSGSGMFGNVGETLQDALDTTGAWQSALAPYIVTEQAKEYVRDLVERTVHIPRPLA